MKPNWLLQTIDLFGDTFFYTVSKLIPGLLTLVAVGIFIRILGAEHYGYWAICNAMVMLIISFCFGWIRQAILRFKSGEDTYIDFTRRIASVDSIIFGTILTLAIGILSLISLRFFFKYTWITMPISIFFLLYIIFFGVFNVWGTYLQAWRRRTTMVLAETFKAIIGIIPAIYFAVHWGVAGALAGYALGSFIAACWLGFVLKKNFSSRSLINIQVVKSGRQDNWVTWWAYGWPVSLWLALLSFIPIVDRILIQSYLGIVKSGVYAASYDIIVRGYSLFLFPITLAVHPRIMAALNSGNQNIAYQHIKHAKAITMGIVVLSMFGILLLYPLFYQYIVKVETQEALSRVVLVIIALGGGGWQVALLSHKPLEIANKTKLMVAGLLIALIVNITIQIALLKILGVLATALALVFSAFTYICFCRYWAEKLNDTIYQGRFSNSNSSKV